MRKSSQTKKTKLTPSTSLWPICLLCLSNSQQARGWAPSSSSINHRKKQRNFRTLVIQQSSSLVYTPDSSETNEILLHLLEEQECEGLEALELGINKETGLRGLYSKLEFQQGEYICALPFPSTILLEDNIVSSMNGVYGKIDNPIIRQGLRLLQDFASDSNQQWKPYLDTVPTVTDAQFDAIPDFYDDSVIKQLQIPRMVEESRARKREISRVAQEAGVSAEQLQWTTWIAQTRGFSTFKMLRNKDKDEATLQQRAWLLPFLDMLNHGGSSPNASIEVVETPGSYKDSFFALQVLTPISIGDEVTISYGTGRETCLDLFSTYGFWTEDNGADEYLLDWLAVDPQWTTSLEQDETTLNETTDSTLQKVLALRIHLKQLQEWVGTKEEKN